MLKYRLMRSVTVTADLPQCDLHKVYHPPVTLLCSKFCSVLKDAPGTLKIKQIKSSDDYI